MLCDNLERWDGGQWDEREGIYVYLWLIRFVIQQKPTKHCKAIILQLIMNLKKSSSSTQTPSSVRY